jgi:hypothetical protein
MNTLENYYIRLCHEQNMIIKEQNQRQKNPLLELSCDIQFQHAEV